MSRRTFTDEFDGLDEWGAEHLVRSRWLNEPSRYRGRHERVYKPKVNRLKQRQRWQRIAGHRQLERLVNPMHWGSTFSV